MDMMQSINKTVQERANNLSDELVDKIISRLFFLDGMPPYKAALITSYIAQLREYAVAQIKLTRLNRSDNRKSSCGWLSSSNVYDHAEIVWKLKQRKDVLKRTLQELGINTKAIDLIVGREPRDTKPCPSSLYLARLSTRS
jgi:hypothetical protein